MFILIRGTNTCYIITFIRPSIYVASSNICFDDGWQISSHWMNWMKQNTPCFLMSWFTEPSDRQLLRYWPRQITFILHMGFIPFSSEHDNYRQASNIKYTCFRKKCFSILMFMVKYVVAGAHPEVTLHNCCGVPGWLYILCSGNLGSWTSPATTLASKSVNDFDWTSLLILMWSGILLWYTGSVNHLGIPFVKLYQKIYIIASLIVWCYIGMVYRWATNICRDEAK